MCVNDEFFFFNPGKVSLQLSKAYLDMKQR